MSRPLMWWPVPAEPSAWFSEEERNRSAEYHRPLGRAAVAKFGGRAALLLAAAVLGWSSDGVSASPVGVEGFVAWVIVAAVAWWAPAAGADWWFEYRHEPRFGREPLPGGRFLLVIGGGLALTVLAAAAGAGLLLALYNATPMWWLLVAVVIGGFLVVAGVIGARFAPAAFDLSPLPPDPQLTELTKRSGVTDVEFGVASSDAIVGLNAMTVGRRSVVLSSGLQEADRGLRLHVVGHELSHLRHHHSRRAAAVTASLQILSMALGLRLAGSIADVDEPRALPAVVLVAASVVVAVSPVLAWLDRIRERVADFDAIGWTPEITLEQLRLLHLTDRADLEPSTLARLVASHPPPAQRLASAERQLRRAAW